MHPSDVLNNGPLPTSCNMRNSSSGGYWRVYAPSGRSASYAQPKLAFRAAAAASWLTTELASPLQFRGIRNARSYTNGTALRREREGVHAKAACPSGLRVCEVNFSPSLRCGGLAQSTAETTGVFHTRVPRSNELATAGEKWVPPP
jgi:hypothetical protein